MEKIDLVEILKDCPTGMELDSPVWNNIVFEEIDCGNIVIFRKSIGAKVYLTQYGAVNNIDGNCVIFPKGKTTWEGFHRPFKDGDILATDLGSVFYLNTRLIDDERYGCYVGIGGDGSFLHICESFAYKECCGFATEEEKEKLFKAIKDNGYKWNPETKTLEKLSKSHEEETTNKAIFNCNTQCCDITNNLIKKENKTLEEVIKPRFRVGDKIRLKSKHNCIYTVFCLTWGDNGKLAYKLLPDNDKHLILISLNRQDEYELVSSKFDINTLKPFDKVLVRDNNAHKWTIDFFGFINEYKRLPFVCVGDCVTQCIPYEGNEHLLGKTDDCDKYFKTWK